MTQSTAGTLNVVCAADDAYAMPLAVMLRSLMENLGEGHEVDIWILYDGIGAVNRWRVQRSMPFPNARIHWIPVRNSLLANVPVFGHVTLATYYRLLIPAALPQEVRRVLYLDVDIVVKGDVSAIFQDPRIDGCPLLAVEEPKWQSDTSVLHRIELGMRPESMYLNAGVLFLNLDEWRRMDWAAKIISFLNDPQTKTVIKWHDQDGLNVVLEGLWGRLGREWNTRVDPADGMSLPAEPLKRAQLIHFASAIKPWSCYARSPHVSLFYETLDRTAWSGWRPRKPFRDTWGNRHWYGAMARQVPFLGPLWKAIRDGHSHAEGRES